MAVTLDDVARLAGVSKSTVSRVLNNEPYVRESTRRAVLDAVKKLQYTPNIPSTFSGLSSALNTIGVYPGISLSRLSYDPFYKQIMDAVALECSERGYGLTYLVPQRTDEDSLVEIIESTGVKGVVSWGCPPNLVYRIREMGIPQVLVNQRYRWRDIPKILIEDYGGAYKATDYLAKLGHRRIGFICGCYGESIDKSFEERFEGYKGSLRDNGLEFSEDLLAVEETSIDPPGIKAGYNAARDLLERCNDVTAIMAANDLLAIGAVHYLADVGIRVAEDISIVGFDNIPSTQHVMPPLTTVAVPMNEMGRLAVEVCVNLIDGKPSSDEIIRVGVELVIRESCKVLKSVG